MLDNDSVMARTVNGFKTKLERERAKKMGLFLDGAVTEFRSGRPASILQVTRELCKAPLYVIGQKSGHISLVSGHNSHNTH